MAKRAPWARFRRGIPVGERRSCTAPGCEARPLALSDRCPLHQRAELRLREAPPVADAQEGAP